MTPSRTRSTLKNLKSSHGKAVPEIGRRTMLKTLGIAPFAAALPGVLAALPTEKRHGNSSGTAAERIARFIVEARYEDIPVPVIRKAKEQVAFFVGRALEGHADRKADHVRQVAMHMTPASGGVTVIGEPFRLLPADAAFANCSLMRGSTRDDVIWPAGIHAGVITLPTALAVGEWRHISGRELLLSLIIAYEVLGKLGDVADGWAAPMPRRPTIIYGGFGPVTVCGRLLELDHHRMTNALGYAANLGMGIPEGGMMEHYYSFINRNGILGAQIAAAGGTPYKDTTIEGPLGLYRSFFGEVPAKLWSQLDRLGTDWEILKADQKHYPGTGTNAVAVKLLSDLSAEEKLAADEVRRIDVWIRSEQKSRTEVGYRGPFRTAVEAYSSIPYALALVLVDGELTLDRYAEDAGDEVINDPVVAEVMQRVNVILDVEEGGDLSRYCRIELDTKDGRKFVREAERFDYPFPPDVWSAWLYRHGKGVLTIERLQATAQCLREFEALPDVTSLMETLRPG